MLLPLVPEYLSQGNCFFKCSIAHRGLFARVEQSSVFKNFYKLDFASILIAESWQVKLNTTASLTGELNSKIPAASPSPIQAKEPIALSEGKISPHIFETAFKLSNPLSHRASLSLSLSLSVRIYTCTNKHICLCSSTALF